MILDSPVNPLVKIELAKKISEHLEAEDGKVPNLGHVFDPLPEDEGERAEVVELREELQDQLDRGATHAFSPSFAIAALIAPAGADPDRPGAEDRAVTRGAGSSSSAR